jgi:PKD repeat protein
MARRNGIVFGLVAALVLLPATASAAGTIDQSQTDYSGGLYGASTTLPAQTFTAGLTGPLDTVSLHPAINAQNDLLQIRTVSDGVPTATVLASEIITSSVIDTWVDVSFTVPAEVTAGTQYAIVVVAPSGYWMFGSTPNGVDSYAAGLVMYYSQDGQWRTINMDLTFRTYVTQAPVPVPPVAAFTATPDNGYAPLAVQFDASTSSDGDGSITSYDWDFGDGATTTTDGPTTSHTYGDGPDKAGCVCTVTLTVTDNDTLTDAATATVDVVKFRWSVPTLGTPNFNHAAAGTVFPVGFSLGGFHGLAPFVAGFPRSHPISCSSGQLIGGSAWPQAIQSGSLTYDAARSRYTWDWVTRPGWSGTCRMFQVQLGSGQRFQIRVAFDVPPKSV